MEPGVWRTLLPSPCSWSIQYTRGISRQTMMITCKHLSYSKLVCPQLVGSQAATDLLLTVQAVILPDGVDELDPAVLGTLPPSMQLEFALKLRERKQAENREHFQKHTGKPTDFSSFQMQQYLKGSQLK